MRFHRSLAFVFPLLLIGGCEPLPERGQPLEATELGHTPLDSLPAAYGQLVAVTPHFGRAGPSDWYDLWFSEPSSGTITLVPVRRTTLSYSESAVTTIERTPTDTAPMTPQSAP